MRYVACIAGVLMAGSVCAAPPASPSDAPACPPSPKVTLIAAYGDSTTQGVPAGQNMPAYLEAALCHYKVTNEGVSGTRADQLLNGTDGRHKPWADEMKQSKARIVLLNFGINDSHQAGETVQSYSMNMDLLVRTAKDAGKLVVLQTPNPIYPTLKADAPDAKLQQHAQAVRKLAKAEHVPLIDVNASMLALLAQVPLQVLYADTLHPTPAGYQAIANVAAKVIETMHVTP
jgi:acyl-CoA thioesterase-1